MEMITLVFLMMGLLFKTGSNESRSEGSCRQPLGMESGEIQNSQLSSSDPSSTSSQARLNTPGGWSTTPNSDQYIMANLLTAKNVSAVAIQGHGRFNNFTRTLRLLYSLDGLVWEGYWHANVTTTTTPPSLADFGQELRASENRRSVAMVMLDPPIQAQFIVISPVSWRGSPTLRFDLHGCLPLTPVETTTTHVGQDIEGNTVWRKRQSPYVIGRKIFVRPSGYLTIEAGVKVVFTSPEAGIVVDGVLKSEGRPGSRIRFSSDRVPLGENRHWSGIKVISGELHLTNTDILQARTGIYGPAGKLELTSFRIARCGIGVNMVDGARDASWVSVDGATIEKCDYGIQVTATPMKSHIQILRCNVARNQQDGIEVRDYVKFAISDCEIFQNGRSGIAMDSSYTTEMRFTNLVVKKNSAHGMALNFRGNFIPRKNVVIVNSKFVSNKFDGVNLKGQFGRNPEIWNIRDNVFLANNKSGLNLSIDAGSSDMRGLFVQNNTFTNHNARNIPVLVVDITGNYRYSGSYVFQDNVFTRNQIGMLLRLDGQPEFYQTRITNNFFSGIIHGPAMDVDADGVEIRHNRLIDCESDGVMNIRRGHTNQVHNNSFQNPKAEYDLLLGTRFQMGRTINATLNYWGTTRDSLVRSRVKDFYSDPDLIIANISPYFTSKSLRQTSVGIGETYFVNAFGLAGGQLYTNLTVHRGSLLRVGRTIRIHHNATMTVEPGAKILFRKYSGIYVEGALRMLGSSSQLIRLQPEDPARYPRWSGIRVNNAEVEIKYTVISDSVACLKFTEPHPARVQFMNVSCIRSAEGIVGTIRGHSSISLYNCNFVSILKHGIYFSLAKNLNLTLQISSTKLAHCQHGTLTLEDTDSTPKQVIVNLKKITLLENHRGIFFYTYTNVQLRFSLVDSVIQQQGGYALNLDSLVVKLAISRTKFLDNVNGVYISVRGREQCTEKMRFSDNEFSNSLQGRELQIYGDDRNGGCPLLLSRNYFHQRIQHLFGALYISPSRSTRIGIRNNIFKDIFGSAVEISAERGGNYVTVFNNTINHCGQGVVIQSVNAVAIEITHNSVINNLANNVIDLDSRSLTDHTPVISFTYNALENSANETVVVLRQSNVALHYNIFSNPSATYNVKLDCETCGESEVNATLNYWGTVESQKIVRMLHDKRSESRLPKIAFTPYMRDRRLQTLYSTSAKFLADDRTLGGMVGGHVTLSADGGPYTVVSSIVIGSNDMLTIEPGVTLLFYTNIDVTVEGVLRINGTSFAPVTFKPFITGSRWNRMEIMQTPENSKHSLLQHLMMRSTEYGLTIKGEVPRMSHVTSTDSSHAGINIKLSDSVDLAEIHHINSSFNSGPGIDITMSGENGRSFKISDCTLRNNYHGFLIKHSGQVEIEGCMISFNTHSGVHAEGFNSGKLNIHSSEFERNGEFALASIPDLENGVSGGEIHFEMSFCVIVDHDLSASAASVKELVSLQNTAQKSGVWKIVDCIFTKNKNMNRAVAVAFQNGDQNSHLVEIRNSAFVDNIGNALTLTMLHRPVVNIRLVNNSFRNNQVSDNQSLVAIGYSLSREGKVFVSNNAFIQNSARDILNVNLAQSSWMENDIFKEARVTENVFKGNDASNILNLSNYGISAENNTFVNPSATCEISTPSFHTSRNISAAFSYWGHPNLESIVERICGFDKDMRRALVYYLPFRSSQAWNDFARFSETAEMFSLETVYGGEVITDVEVDNSRLVYPIRSDEGSLLIHPGLHLRFAENRGIYVAGKLIIGRNTQRTTLSSLGAGLWRGLVFNQRYREAYSNVRLVGGAKYSEGRVEIQHDGQFGTICDDEFDERAARVICGMLGFDSEGESEVFPGGHFGSGTGPILLDNVVCLGYEPSIDYCSFPGWAVQNCNHGEDVGVACHGEFLIKDLANRVSAIENVDIIGASTAITLLGPKVDIANCHIKDAVNDGILVTSNLFPVLDLRGSSVEGGQSHGINVNRLSGIAIKNVTVKNVGGRGINARLAGGNLELTYVTVKNSYDYGIQVTLHDQNRKHGVKISHSVTSDHARGSGVFVDSKNHDDKSCLIDINGNKFSNNSYGSVYIRVGMSSGITSKLEKREVLVSRNLFEKSGSNFIQTEARVNLTISGNRFVRGESGNDKDCLLNVATVDRDIALMNGNVATEDGDPQTALSVKHVNISTNVFSRSKGHCVVKLSSGSSTMSGRDAKFIGEFQYNQILQSWVEFAVVMATKHYNMSYNILDNPSSAYELGVTARGREVIHAEHNWWGTRSTKDAKARIHDRKQDGGLLKVEFEPMLIDHTFDCSEVDGCSGHGECVSPNRCLCSSGWDGPNCDDVSCDDVDGCSGHGICIGPNRCDCRSGWSGESCHVATCVEAKNCSGHGVCHMPGLCVCYPEYAGFDCSRCSDKRWGVYCQLCPLCVHGKCNLDNGLCECNEENWAGPLCNKCAPTFYGPHCRREAHVTHLVPNGGPDTGGTLVHVWGNNFPETRTRQFYCRFGLKAVPGWWLSRNHLTCRSPKNYAANVIFEVSPDGRTNYTNNELMFAYHGKCLRRACGRFNFPPHGDCIFGECLCKTPRSGTTCSTELYAPLIRHSPEVITIEEGGNFSMSLRLKKGTAPVTWSLLNFPPGMELNRDRGDVTWSSVPGLPDAESYFVRVQASNLIGSDTISWNVTAPYSHSVEILKIDASNTLPVGQRSVHSLLPYPQKVRIEGSVQVTSPSFQQRSITLILMVEHKGILRLLEPVCVTVPAGKERVEFVTVFVHKSDDMGIFTLVTAHPAVRADIPYSHVPANLNELGHWSVLGMRCMPDHVKRTAWILEDQTITFRNITVLRNTGPEDLNVDISSIMINGARSHGQMTLTLRRTVDGQPQPLHISPGASEAVDVIIKSAQAIEGRAAITFTDSHFESRLSAQLTLEFHLKLRQPKLYASPQSFSTTLLIGSNNFYEVEFINIGKSPAEDVNVFLPDDPRFSLISFSTSTVAAENDQSDSFHLPPRTAAILVFMVTIPAGATEDKYTSFTGSINVHSSSATLSLPITLKGLTSDQSDLIIRVEDDGRSPLQGAVVTLSNPSMGYSHSITTYITGLATFGPIRSAHYTLTVEFTDHLPYRDVISLAIGSSNKTVYLPRIPLKQRWTVTRPLDSDDTYNVSVRYICVGTAKNHSPAVVVEPSMVDLTPYEQELGQTMEFIITNVGNSSVEGLHFHLPVLRTLKFEQTKVFIGNIAANNSLAVSLKVKGQARQKRNLRETTACSFPIVYDFGSEDSHEIRRVDVILTRGRSSIPPLPCLTDFNDADLKDADDKMVPLAYKYEYLPVTHLPGNCARSKVKQCSLDFQPMAGCSSAVSDLAMSTNDLAFLIGALDTAFTCVISVFCPQCDTLVENIRCLTEVKAMCNSSTRGQSDVSATYLDNLLQSAARIDNFLELMADILGDIDLFSVASRGWFDGFKTMLWDSSDKGVYLSQGELQAILRATPVSTQSMVTDFLHRWNNTAAAWENGIKTTPGSDNVNVMSHELIQSNRERFQRDTKLARQEGYHSVFDQFDTALKKYSTEVKKKTKAERDDLCASIQVSINKQEVTDGETFTVTIRLDKNINATSEIIQNIKLEFHVLSAVDGETIVDNDFMIGVPRLKGIMGIDGTGRLATGISASAYWSVTPRRSALSLGDAIYYLGGRITYSVGSSFHDEKLVPNFVRVRPKPKLTVHMFYPRSIAKNGFAILTKEPMSFSLVIMVSNIGYGNCLELKLVSARPEIIGQKGENIPFRIRNLRLANKFTLPGLSAEFDNLEPNESKTAHWILTSSVSGSFRNCSVVFENADRYGNHQLSEIENYERHNLFHDMRINTPFDDGVGDFLVDDLPMDNIPERLYDGGDFHTTFPVHLWNVAQVRFDRKEFRNNKQYNTVSIFVHASRDGWGYIRVDDTTTTLALKTSHLLTVKCITRSENLPVQNSWTTFPRADKALVHIVHFLPRKYSENVQYSLLFGPRNLHAPRFTESSQIFYVAEDKPSGSTLFVITATDGDGNRVRYELSPLSPRFEINKMTGSIRLIENLHVGEQYSLNIAAFDNGIPAKSSAVNITVHVNKDGIVPLTTPAVIAPATPPWENVTGATPNITTADIDNEKSKKYMWIVFLVVGIVGGILLFVLLICLLYKYACKSNGKNQSPKKKGKFDKYKPEVVQMEAVRA